MFLKKLNSKSLYSDYSPKIRSTWGHAGEGLGHAKECCCLPGYEEPRVQRHCSNRRAPLLVNPLTSWEVCRVGVGLLVADVGSLTWVWEFHNLQDLACAPPTQMARLSVLWPAQCIKRSSISMSRLVNLSVHVTRTSHKSSTHTRFVSQLFSSCDYDQCNPLSR